MKTKIEIEDKIKQNNDTISIFKDEFSSSNYPSWRKSSKEMIFEIEAENTVLNWVLNIKGRE